MKNNSWELSVNGEVDESESSPVTPSVSLWCMLCWWSFLKLERVTCPAGLCKHIPHG